MAQGPSPNDSDDSLDRLLAEAGSGYDGAAIREILPGVLAAPEGLEARAWMALIGSATTPALEARLEALKAEAAADLAVEETSPGGPARLAALRRELAKQGLDGFLVPLADEHQGEYIPLRARRLAWLTGFAGSAGLAVVLPDKAAIFVDGRYTLQVREQVDEAFFAPRHLIDEPPERWIEAELPEGGKLGYDPWLHTRDQVVRLGKAARKAGGEIAACARNPIDAVWASQPAPPIAPVTAHPIAHAGRDSADKRAEIAGTLRDLGAAAAVLTLPDSIAWLLNVRGGDVSRTPLALSFAILHDDGTVDWFIDRRKLTSRLDAHLGPDIRPRPPEDLGPALDALGAAHRTVRVDPATAAAWVFDRLELTGATIAKGADPCQLPKARKNEVELEGTRRAHRRDGAALTGFLAWLAGEVARQGSERDSNEGVSELEAAERLAGFRAATGALRDLSFDTISGSGPNGALPHYRVSEASNRRLGQGEIYLVDSGGQYADGTTDVTRTLAIGAPTAEMRERFTRVLKGHIALATARFPRGTTGSQIDSLARMALWQAGLDYDHGTGHGVGSYLGVHEGPQRISKIANRTALEPGMIVSNEPGYYKTGAYGIRIENLVAVMESEKQPGEERDMLAFETLTLAPIDRSLVDTALLTPPETAWLDAYHARVREELTPQVDAETARWLAEATRPLAADGGS